MILAANAAVGVITETNAEKALEVSLTSWQDFGHWRKRNIIILKWQESLRLYIADFFTLQFLEFDNLPSAFCILQIITIMSKMLGHLASQDFFVPKASGTITMYLCRKQDFKWLLLLLWSLKWFWSYLSYLMHDPNMI